MERDVLYVSLSLSLSLSLSIVLELRGLKLSFLPPSVLLSPTRYHVFKLHKKFRLSCVIICRRVVRKMFNFQDSYFNTACSSNYAGTKY